MTFAEEVGILAAVGLDASHENGEQRSQLRLTWIVKQRTYMNNIHVVMSQSTCMHCLQ